MLGPDWPTTGEIDIFEGGEEGSRSAKGGLLLSSSFPPSPHSVLQPNDSSHFVGLLAQSHRRPDWHDSPRELRCEFFAELRRADAHFEFARSQSSGGNNNGCGVYGKSPNSYGPSLASAGGGIFATQWTTAGCVLSR